VNQIGEKRRPEEENPTPTEEEERSGYGRQQNSRSLSTAHPWMDGQFIS
jgi:hypothetical protein